MAKVIHVTPLLQMPGFFRRLPLILGFYQTTQPFFLKKQESVIFFNALFQCSPYQAVTGKIYRLKQQQATVLTAYNLLMVY